MISEDEFAMDCPCTVFVAASLVGGKGHHYGYQSSLFGCLKSYNSFHDLSLSLAVCGCWGCGLGACQVDRQDDGHRCDERHCRDHNTDHGYHQPPRDRERNGLS